GRPGHRDAPVGAGRGRGPPAGAAAAVRTAAPVHRAREDPRARELLRRETERATLQTAARGGDELETFHALAGARRPAGKTAGDAPGNLSLQRPRTRGDAAHLEAPGGIGAGHEEGALLPGLEREPLVGARLPDLRAREGDSALVHDSARDGHVNRATQRPPV